VVPLSAGPRYTLSTFFATRRLVSILPSLDKTPEAEAQLAADLNVMCAVVDRLLDDAGVRTQSWGFKFGQAQRSTRGLYIPEFGVLLFVQIDFPLAPTAQAEEDATGDSHDALWSQMRRSLHGTTGIQRYASEGLPSYDELKVENLRRTILRALPYARNIRGLADDEAITVVATQSSNRPGMPAPMLAGTNVSAPATRMRILSFQTRKADTDALGAGQLDTEVFQQRVTTLNYDLPELGAKGYRQSR
jgi:hypothetical protein